MRTLPNTVPALIEELDKLYPPRCIKPQETLAEAQRYAGAREVVELLKNKLAALEQRARRDDI